MAHMTKRPRTGSGKRKPKPTPKRDRHMMTAETMPAMHGPVARHRPKKLKPRKA